MNKLILTPENPEGIIVPLTAEEIAEREQEMEAHQTFMAANQYKFDREEAYPSIQEQLDMQYWDSVNGTTVWADTIAAVKAANPKPE
jgi:hypothetical protein